MMKQLEYMYGNEKEFYFALGTDLIPGLKRWDEGEKLLNEMKFIIFHRVSHPFDSSPKNPMLPKTFVEIDPSNHIIGKISSTEVRQRISKMKCDAIEADRLSKELKEDEQLKRID